MGELKFRAWNEWADRNEMTYFKIDESKAIENTAWNAEIMQYTGLKDKNGKEIYEGDVIKQTYHKTIGYGDNEENFEGYHIGEVVLISSGECIKKPLMYEVEIDQLVKLDGYKNVAGYRSEVIGNIYENPELIKARRI